MKHGGEDFHSTTLEWLAETEVGARSAALVLITSREKTRRFERGSGVECRLNCAEQLEGLDDDSVLTQS